MLNDKLILLLCLVFTCSLPAQDSLNMEQLYNYDDDDLPISPQDVYFNDCWGYTDADGNEYAIVGGAENIFFFNITDPENTTLIRKFFDGDSDISGGLDLDNTTWRDFKTYGEKAYAVADQSTSNEGLIVFDLSELPDTVTVEEQTTAFFTKSHNIFIDTARGYLYTAGASGSGANDVVILDLNADPIEEVANVDIDGGYIHDIHVVNDTAYCNSAFHEFYIIDFTDPENPSTIGFLDGYTGSGYNHSGWLTDDGNYYVFCDETQGRKVKILDVSNPATISNADITDQFFSNLLNENATNPTNIAHNPFIKGDLVFIAYYNDGVQVFDISDPYNVVREGYYDTFDNVNYSGAYDGVWGVYPYFDSGSIIASDGENGLFVLRMIEAPLLVDLIEFNATKDQKKVKLNWATASERNSEVFEIERSIDGENFYPIKSVAANNNSNQRIDYEIYDETPFAGTNYYRLKQIDFDGEFQYSAIKSVLFKGQSVAIAPNYVENNQEVSIYLDTPVDNFKVEIVSMSGQLLTAYDFAGATELVKIPTADLQSGLYFFKIQYNQTIVTEKVVIAK